MHTTIRIVQTQYKTRQPKNKNGVYATVKTGANNMLERTCVHKDMINTYISSPLYIATIIGICDEDRNIHPSLQGLNWAALWRQR